MTRTAALALLFLAGCGAAPGVPVASETTAGPATAPSSAPAAAPASSSASASAAPAPSATADDATADSSTDPDAPPAAPAHVKTVEKPLPNTPFFVTVPVTAVLKKGDGDLNAEVLLDPSSSYRLTIRPRLVMFMPLDEELKDLAKDKLKLVSKSGAGDQYTVVYKPYPNMFTYLGYFSVGGKDMSCLVEGLYHQDDIPTYDAICKSVRLKKR
jgi:hypothetical protein